MTILQFIALYWLGLAIFIMCVNPHDNLLMGAALLVVSGIAASFSCWRGEGKR